jgi:hypothetical protein
MKIRAFLETIVLWQYVSSLLYVNFASNPIICWVPVDHTYNPTYLGGRNQEDGGMKPAQANSLQHTNLKIPNTKKRKGLAEWLKW